jgi:hypothetical protein
MDESNRGVLIGLSSIIAVSGAVLLWAIVTALRLWTLSNGIWVFSPDDGDGSLEVTLLTVLVMIVTLAAFRWASKVTAP